jgi:phospholipid/cholesterol/gamma-HCH transport system ATP-binding protein
MEPVREDIHMHLIDVHKSFGDVAVLRGINLTIQRAKINIIIGGSGVGKSVLLRHMIGLLKPDRGKILLDGEDIVSMSEFKLNKIRRKFGMLFQYSALFDSMNVYENVAFPLREHTSLKEREIQERVFEKLSLLKIADAAWKMPAEISGGMKKRVGLARAIILNPEIIMYDEPTTGLDPIATRQVDDMIKEMAEKLGVTSVVISHDIASAFRIGDKIAMLHEGKIIFQGDANNILSSSEPVINEFIGAAGIK